MFENLLEKMLEKLAEGIGGVAASIVLDEKTRSKRASFELYHALRDLEEALEIAVGRFEHVAYLHETPHWLIDRKFLDAFATSLERAQSALTMIDAKIEIYESRDTVEYLQRLLHSDVDAMAVIFGDNYRRYTTHQWKELVEETRNAAKKARAIVAKFIADKFPM